MTSFNAIVLDTDGIHLDDIHLDGMKLDTDISVQHYGDDLHKVTISVYATTVEITEAVRLRGAARITEHGDGSAK